MLTILNFLVCTRNLWSVKMSNGNYDLSYNNNTILDKNCPEYYLESEGTHISLCNSEVYSKYTLHNKVQYTNFTEQTIEYNPVDSILPTVNLTFNFLHEQNNSVLIKLYFNDTIKTNYISPMKNGKLLPVFDEPRVLNVPQDNDLQSFYTNFKLSPITKGTSSYVTTIYDGLGISNNGLVIGFLEHNIWKTGVEYDYYNINAVCGINGKLLTRDSIPHGMVNLTETPTLFISFNNDWRDGMEQYADMVMDYSPYKANTSLLPISGWNSWALAIDHIGMPTEERLMSASNVLHNLSNFGFGDKQYINRDAIYDLSNNKTNNWTNYVISNNQSAGTYTSPIVLYKPTGGNYINCKRDFCNSSTPNCWLYTDIIVKDKYDNPIRSLAWNKLSNKGVLDITHPASICIFEEDLKEIKQFNYSFIKIDFINYAAFEGEHYNKTIASTGMEAYLYYLTILHKMFDGMVIDYGISLLMPFGPGVNTKRHACDQMFGGVMYSMNNYAGGWWTNRFYMLDPDLVSFEEHYWFTKSFKLTKYISMDAKSRVAKAVVYGGVFKNGDDLSNKTNVGIVNYYLGNPKVNEMWSRGRVGDPKTTFRPINWIQNSIIPFISIIKPPNVFTRTNGDVAIFNYDIFNKQFNVDLSNIISNTTKTCIELWSNINYTIVDYLLIIKIDKLSSVLLECR